MGPANVMTPICVIVALGHTLAPVPNYTVGKHGQKVEGGWTTCPELLRSRPATGGSRTRDLSVVTQTPSILYSIYTSIYIGLLVTHPARCATTRNAKPASMRAVLRRVCSSSCN